MDEVVHGAARSIYCWDGPTIGMTLFNAELAEKRQIVVINKTDLPVVRENLTKVLPWFAERGLKVFPISAATGEGIPPLLDEIARNLWGKAEED